MSLLTSRVPHPTGSNFGQKAFADGDRRTVGVLPVKVLLPLMMSCMLYWSGCTYLPMQ